PAAHRHRPRPRALHRVPHRRGRRVASPRDRAGAVAAAEPEGRRLRARAGSRRDRGRPAALVRASPPLRLPRASLVSYLLPVTALFYGALILHERVTLGAL